VEMATVTPEDVAYAVQKQLEGDGRSIGEILLERGMVKSQDLLAAVQVQQAAKSVVSESSIRVDVVLLDRLMNLVGELVLARNQILQHTQGVQDAGLVASGQRLNLITSELQEGVMKTRMQPIGNIWSKFPRTVRDVAMSCGKSVRIEMEGKETELDKTIIEAIKDPLTHLVRNSVDHGIETPDKRVQAGKTEEGLLLLRAYHEGGQIEFEPAGKHTGWSRPGDRGDEFCAGTGGEPGDAERDGASAGTADAAGFPEVNQKRNL
jgi:two-component system, chemotaxis family, sensor kinase CheA